MRAPASTARRDGLTCGVRELRILHAPLHDAGGLSTWACWSCNLEINKLSLRDSTNGSVLHVTPVNLRVVPCANPRQCIVGMLEHCRGHFVVLESMPANSQL